nr:hypothetical protein Iba_chr03cCG3660 [Ipomoea batatas]
MASSVRRSNGEAMADKEDVGGDGVLLGREGRQLASAADGCGCEQCLGRSACSHHPRVRHNVKADNDQLRQPLMEHPLVPIICLRLNTLPPPLPRSLSSLGNDQLRRQLGAVRQQHRAAAVAAIPSSSLTGSSTILEPSFCLSSVSGGQICRDEQGEAGVEDEEEKQICEA